MFTGAEKHKIGTANDKDQLRESISEHQSKNVQENEFFTATFTKNQTIEKVRSDGSPMPRASDKLYPSLKPNHTPVAPATENLEGDTEKN